MKKRSTRIAMSVLVALVTAGALLALPGCNDGEPDIGGIWSSSAEAERGIDALHMVISIYYQNTKYGSGQIQTTTIDVSGNDVHASSALFGQDFSEVFVVGGTQYTKIMGEEQWTQQPATLDRSQVTQQLEGFANLPDVASSQENVGVENIGGVEAWRLSFTLAPDEVSTLFSNVPASQLSANGGGNVDVWVDRKENYKVRYEALIRNALITEEIGYGDIRIVVAITDINQPISITPPL